MRKMGPRMLRVLFVAAVVVVLCSVGGGMAEDDLGTWRRLAISLREEATRLEERVRVLEANLAYYHLAFGNISSPNAPPHPPPQGGGANAPPTRDPLQAPPATLQDEIDLLVLRERERKRRLALDAAMSEDGAGAVEVAISCTDGAMVTIVDLPDDEVSQGVCNVFRFQAPQLSAQLVLRCDGTAQATGFPTDDDDAAAYDEKLRARSDEGWEE
jgi:hypothetical protein